MYYFIFPQFAGFLCAQSGQELRKTKENPDFQKNSSHNFCQVYFSHNFWGATFKFGQLSHRIIADYYLRRITFLQRVVVMLNSTKISKFSRCVVSLLFSRVLCHVILIKLYSPVSCCLTTEACKRLHIVWFNNAPLNPFLPDCWLFQIIHTRALCPQKWRLAWAHTFPLSCTSWMGGHCFLRLNQEIADFLFAPCSVVKNGGVAFASTKRHGTCPRYHEKGCESLLRRPKMACRGVPRRVSKTSFQKVCAAGANSRAAPPSAGCCGWGWDQGSGRGSDSLGGLKARARFEGHEGSRQAFA